MHICPSRGEILKTVEIKWYRIKPDGKQEHIHPPFAGRDPSALPYMRNRPDRDSEEYPHMEEVSFTYRKDHLDLGARGNRAEADWRELVVTRAPQPITGSSHAPPGSSSWTLSLLSALLDETLRVRALYRPRGAQPAFDLYHRARQRRAELDLIAALGAAGAAILRGRHPDGSRYTRCFNGVLARAVVQLFCRSARQPVPADPTTA